MEYEDALRRINYYEKIQDLFSKSINSAKNDLENAKMKCLSKFDYLKEQMIKSFTIDELNMKVCDF